MAAPLKTVLFLGSARNAAPFWGGLPTRTGDRVAAFTLSRVEALNAAAEGAPALEVELLDPLKFPSVMSLETLDGNPTYYAAKDPSTLPEDLQALIKAVEEADCFIICCPEYNHTIPPALTAMMNQVGCSKYANKVSGSICYSGFPSAAGGARCAVALRPFLSELGCLPGESD
jgi:chromate reductase